MNRNNTVLACAICERTLLLGERAASYHAPGRMATVCELCVDEADLRGWRRAGTAAPPAPVARVERGPGLVARLLGRDRRAVEVSEEPREPGELPVKPAGPPSGSELAREGADLFNESQFSRTINGLRRSLGVPRVSVVPLSGSRPNVVVTVAWDISWYQYRVDAQKAEIHLEGRGDDPEDLDARWQSWNAHLAADGRVQVAV